jgi:hypothetical protein
MVSNLANCRNITYGDQCFSNHSDSDEVFSILVAVSQQVGKNLNDFLKIIEPSIFFNVETVVLHGKRTFEHIIC